MKIVAGCNGVESQNEVLSRPFLYHNRLTPGAAKLLHRRLHGSGPPADGQPQDQQTLLGVVRSGA
jgi:hypothetical protein